MKSRRPKKITNRISSVTNGFVQAIIPIEVPSSEETRMALAILDMDSSRMSCVYCGNPSTDWDHLQPLVRSKRPSGYLHSAKNLVPSCGPCNQSKSGAHWRKWMLGKAKGSPKVRGVVDLESRVKKLEKFERWAQLQAVSFQDLVGVDKWEKYWSALHEIEDKIREAQALADEIQVTVRRKLSELSA